MSQAFVTIAIPTKTDAATRGGIEAALDDLGNLATDAVRAQFAHSMIVHFMSGSLIRDAAPNEDRLLLEMSCDGEIRDALALFDDEETGLGGLFAPILTLAGHTGGRRSQFLKPYVIETGYTYRDVPGLNFSGSPGMSVRRILDEGELAGILRRHVEERDMKGSPLAIVRALREHVKGDLEAAGLQHLLTPAPVGLLDPEKPGTKWRNRILVGLKALPTFFKPHLVLAAVLAMFLIWLIHDDTGDRNALAVWIGRLIGWVFAFVLLAIGIIGTALTIGIVMLRKGELRDESDYTLPDADILAEVRRREDQAVQNHLTGVSQMKPSPWRRLTLRVGFFMIGTMAGLKYRPGHLDEIGTIHFARWVLLPGTDKLVFFSNYGGSWESYLEDFITKASKGLTAAWSNTIGFPQTYMLIGKGATDGDVFKRWARRQQIPTRFWYVAYPKTTTAQIRRHAAMRKGLSAVATEDEAAAFLALFASRTRPRGDVERGEVQTLLFGGLKRHEQSAHLMIRLPGDAGQARDLVGAIAEKVSFGNAPDPACVFQLALSARGLERLGLSRAELAEFNFPFAQGMGHADRARALGDLGEDAPAHWRWGGEKPETAVDATIFVYVGDGRKAAPEAEEELLGRAETMAKALQKAVRATENLVTGGGGEVVSTITTTNLSTRVGRGKHDVVPKEPFGFGDGVSQPKVSGLERGLKVEPGDQHLMAPGEFILGYPDNRGNRPLSPSLAASRDPGAVLPVLNADHDRTDYPQYDIPGASARRDFGRNGSYIVVRQIEQNVAAFKDYSKAAAAKFAAHPGIPQGLEPDQIQQYLEAKMVGRWQDGTSMVRFPQEPGTGWNGDKECPPDNDFRLGADDPTGEACPFGSHVRRSNPRDSFTPGSKQQLSIVNRHRILRRGRFYKDGEAEGLFFICANADIERQFEFIQQTWSMAAHFHGLEGEVDPLLGRGGENGRLTIPTPKGPIFLSGIPDLITIRGGEYFFLPSKSALRFLSAPG